jgi:hypothetical protein
MSKRDDREPTKRRRGAAQVLAVASLATDCMKMKFIAKDLTALPLDIVKCADELVSSARSLE